MLGRVSARYWANKWGRYVHLLNISQHIWGIIICRRQLLQSYGQLLYPSTVSVECCAESLRDTGPTNGAGMYTYNTYHNRYEGRIICCRQLLQSYGQLLYPSTVLRNVGGSLCRILGQQMGQHKCHSESVLICYLCGYIGLS